MKDGNLEKSIDIEIIIDIDEETRMVIQDYYINNDDILILSNYLEEYISSQSDFYTEILSGLIGEYIEKTGEW